MAGIRFEWDPRKAAANKQRHGISFEEEHDKVIRLISARKATRSERARYDEGWHP